MIIVSLSGEFDFLKLNVDIEKLEETSGLMNGRHFKPLPKEAREEIEKTIREQEESKRNGGYLPTTSSAPGPGSRSARGKNDGRASRKHYYNMYTSPPTSP